MRRSGKSGASGKNLYQHEPCSPAAPRPQQIAALAYAKRGIYVFPLAAGSKLPLRGSHGFYDATCDPAVIAAWWHRWPDANVGIATGSASNIWVLDVDPDGHVPLAALIAARGPLPPTAEASTPRRGRHLYWRWAEGIRNSVGRIACGIDARGQAGSIVAPPSVLADGRSYQWTCTRPPATAPDWLVELTRPPAPPPTSPRRPLDGDADRYVAGAVRAELTALTAAQPGCRNDQLNRSAFNLAQFVKAGALAADWFQRELEGRAVEIGLSLPEARATIASAYRAASPRRMEVLSWVRSRNTAFAKARRAS